MFSTSSAIVNKGKLLHTVTKADTELFLSDGVHFTTG